MDAIPGFLLAATALLGSPGPCIAALVVVGRTCTVRQAVGYFLAMQLGLALAAAVSAAGLMGLLTAVPPLALAMTVGSTIYLVWLAWSIASAPVSGSVGAGGEGAEAWRPMGGFLLAIANPKAYLAFASLFGSFTLLETSRDGIEGLLKWALVVAVMVTVDAAWLLAGRALGRVVLSPRAERAMNVALGAAILLACVAALV